MDNFSPFSAELKDDRVYGRGAANMKGGLAVYLALADHLMKMEGDLPVKVQFQFVVDEKTGADSPYGTALLVKKVHGRFHHNRRARHAQNSKRT